MKYTKKQRLEMLEEMWKETNETFVTLMNNKEFEKASVEVETLDLISKLIQKI